MSEPDLQDTEARLIRLWALVAGLAALAASTVLLTMVGALVVSALGAGTAKGLETMPATAFPVVSAAVVAVLALRSTWMASLGRTLEAQRMMWAVATVAMVLVVAAYVSTRAAFGEWPVLP